jgi:hypothetical protein
MEMEMCNGNGHNSIKKFHTNDGWMSIKEFVEYLKVTKGIPLTAENASPPR